MWPFRKKNDDLDFPTLEPAESSKRFDPGLSDNTGLPSSQDVGSLPSSPSLGIGSSNESADRSELRLISAKLDTISAKLENLNHRLANIEKIAEESQQPQQKQWYKI